MHVKKSLTLAEARQIAAAAEAEAAKNQWNVTIAILDEGGHLLYLERMDDAPLGGVVVAQEKARTAVLFRRPTKSIDADRGRPAAAQQRARGRRHRRLGCAIGTGCPDRPGRCRGGSASLTGACRGFAGPSAAPLGP
jgi:uncharacterized protein GlcG (DUF336 family)